MAIKDPRVDFARDTFLETARQMMELRLVSREDAARGALYAAIQMTYIDHPQRELLTAQWLRLAANTLDPSGIDAEGQTRN